jgi:cell division protein FtsN
VGAFAEAPNAKRLHNKLVRAGYSGSRIKSLRRDGRTLMGVQAGAFTSLPRAKRALSRLRAHFPSCYIASR